MYRLLMRIYLLTHLFSVVCAQKVYLNKISPYFTKVMVEIDAQGTYQIHLDTSYTSVVVKIPVSSSFDSSYILTNNAQVFLRHDGHNDNENYQASQLIVFEKPEKQVELNVTSRMGNIEMQFFNSGPVPYENKKKEFALRTEAACTEPFSVPQDEWRSGLPEPIGTRSGTEVHHIIVHHSAGSNSSQNYLQEVRNIYLLHTQSNGYDDIGYNYLIAPNGVIYKGRDGQKSVEQDNVLGAHMCNQNQNTMGICLLGNFTTQLPTDSAMHSLYYLTGWKTAKEGIKALDSTLHAIGPSGSGEPARLLPNIAGHRDGCSANYTECPGQFLYDRLPSVRDSAKKIKDACIPLSVKNDLEEASKEATIVINGQMYRLGKIDFQEMRLVDVKGITYGTWTGENGVELNDLHSGIYMVHFVKQNGHRVVKIKV